MTTAKPLVVAGLAVLAGCTPVAPDPRGVDRGETLPIYVAVLARSREAYQESRVDGVFDVRDDCAMLGDNLLVLVAGSSLTGTGHRWTLQTAGVKPRRVAPGDRIMAGGAVFPVENLDRVDTDLVLAKPVPARCRAIARGAALAAPIEHIMPAGTSR